MTVSTWAAVLISSGQAWIWCRLSRPDINFKDDSDFTGAAKGYSLAGKLGFTYKLNKTLTLGGVYQTAGNLPDLKGDGYKVEGFDMPAVVALGLAWQANDRLMVAADLKDVMWGSSMNTVTIVTPGGGNVPFPAGLGRPDRGGPGSVLQAQ